MLRATTLLLILAASAHAQERLSQFVPPETAVFAEFDDLGGYEHWVKETSIGRIWAEPEVQTFVSGLCTSIGNGIEAQRKKGPDFFAMLGLTPEDLKGISVQRVGIALIGLDANRRMYPDFVVRVQFRKGAPKIAKILMVLRNAAAMAVGPHAEEKLGELTLWHLTTDRGEMSHTIWNDQLLIASSAARLKQTISMMQGAGKATLAGEAEFRATIATMGAENAGAFFFARPQVIARIVAPLLGSKGDEIAKMIHLAGLDAVKTISFADIPAGPDWRTEFCVRLSERRGLFSLYQDAATSHRFASMTPERPLVYFAERYDLARMIGPLKTMVESVHPGVTEEARRELAKIDEVLGISLKDDLLGSLGDEWAGYIGGQNPRSLIPDGVMFISLKDRARFEKAMRALVTRYPALVELSGETRAPSLRHRRTKFGGHNIDSLELATHRGNPIPVMPSWTVGDDYVAFALWPQPLKNMLARRTSFATNEGFVRVHKRVPEGAASCGYFDLPRVVGFFYNSAVPILQGLQGAADRKLRPHGISLNLHELPRTDVLLRHLSPAVSYSVIKGNDFRMGYVSPCGASLLVGAAAALGVVGFSVDEHEAESIAEAMEQNEIYHQLEILIQERDRLRAQLAGERKRWMKRIDEIEKQLIELERELEKQK